MPESGTRMTQGDHPPSASDIAQWMGRKPHEYWTRVTQLIERNYPNVFSPEWLFGGRKHGWSLRYKKSRSFCTLIPEKNRFAVLIVFGAKEREKVEAVKHSLSAQTREAYDDATAYHDGKWVRMTVETDTALNDIERLLAVKRRPKTEGGARPSV